VNANLALLESAVMFAMAGSVLALSTYITLWTGLLSFATVSFAAIGAFTSTWLASHSGISWPVAALGGAVAGCLAGLLVGYLFRRLSSHWLALATVALVLITQVLVVNLGKVTGGAFGKVVPYKLSFLEMLLVLVLVCVVMVLLTRSKFGMAAAATREDGRVAAALGVPVQRIYLTAFVISGGIGAIGGTMEASQLSFINSDSFYVNLAVTTVASVVLGGAFYWLGAIVGSVVFTGLPVYINQYVSNGQDIVNGILLVAIIIWLPGGLIDPVRWHRIRDRRRQQGSSGGLAGQPLLVGQQGQSADQPTTLKRAE
jgi:branched-chain amino acid transport system permease protein